MPPAVALTASKATMPRADWVRVLAEMAYVRGQYNDLKDCVEKAGAE